MSADRRGRRPPFLRTTLLAWLAMLGFDFFLHAGLLAGFYVRPDPFLLPPLRAFQLIPLGYLSFLLVATLLVWVMRRSRTSGARAGLGFGLAFGALLWGAMTLGLLSISTMRPALAAGWFLGQTAELGIAGLVAGAALAGARLGRLLLQVLGFVVVILVVTMVLQSLGLAPAIHAAGGRP